ncbi:thioredoxin-like protein [Cryphonectria parasitica EP155]|uniref:Thioredoxin-like protein n=1 Tax=Cryphonectria parasitica (strain ATCC 38755 / EP155) TaxID=660469 RepID=A0A9P4XRX9_CRYP1|nr:thioredoxin-like protein [Cryphonectria parasitica EP155]KAF3759908.1 thioredoxin-like protein [Cryphonectria parasitica EP155]
MGSENAAIKLYTNHGCPWAHRAHITLAELGLSFEEEIIDLSVPRTPEYLKVNPRGLVPSLSYNGEIFTESAIVAQFLADTYPSHLLPASSDPKGPRTRARIAFFVDAWFSKCNSVYTKTWQAKAEDEAGELADSLVKVVVKEIEPLLQDAGPFFGGSNKLTFAEVLTAPFVLRLKVFAKHGLLPAGLLTAFAEQAPNFHKWSEAVIKSPSVTGIFDEDLLVEKMKVRIAKAKE